MLATSFTSALAVAFVAFSPLAVALPRPVTQEPTRTSLYRRATSTPVAQLTPPTFLDGEAVRSMLTSMESSMTARSLAARDYGHHARRATTACVDSSANDTLISSLFHYGGPGTVVELCPGATINLDNAVFFSATNQVLTTQGNPTGDSRATLVVKGKDQSVAIYSACQLCDNISIQNLQVYGSWLEMGYNGGAGLVEMGANTFGQTIKNCKLMYPRGWSAVHGIEGDPTADGRRCSSMQILNNEIGPSGAGPNPGTLDGQWADGISIACKQSTVSGNIITDTTDGGIVIFGAPGSVISGNTIVAATRGALGGINAVDYNPWGGTFKDVVVEGNTFHAAGAMIKVGIAIGGMTWGSDNRTAARTYGGTFRNNVFKTSGSGYFGFGISVAGHMNAEISGNTASGASFGGKSSQWCVQHIPPPTPQAFIYDQYTTPGTNMQDNFYEAPIVFAICQVEGGIATTGVPPATGMMLSGSPKPANTSSSALPSSATSTVSSTASASTASSASSSAVSSAASSAVSSAVSSSASSSVVSSAPSSVVSSSDPVPTDNASNGNVVSSNVIASSSTVSSALASSTASSSFTSDSLSRSASSTLVPSVASSTASSESSASSAATSSASSAASSTASSAASSAISSASSAASSASKASSAASSSKVSSTVSSTVSSKVSSTVSSKVSSTVSSKVSSTASSSGAFSSISASAPALAIVPSASASLNSSVSSTSASKTASSAQSPVATASQTSTPGPRLTWLQYILWLAIGGPVDSSGKPILTSSTHVKAFQPQTYNKWSLAVAPESPARLARRFARETPSAHLMNPFDATR